MVGVLRELPGRAGRCLVATMDRARRQVPILGRPQGNILARKALKKAKRRHKKALKNVKASTDNSVPKSMKMKHLKLRLNTRSQRVRKVQVLMEENERMLSRYVHTDCCQSVGACVYVVCVVVPAAW